MVCKKIRQNIPPLPMNSSGKCCGSTRLKPHGALQVNPMGSHNMGLFNEYRNPK
jgi:hypothetical protein